jgi:hypothetical protein
LDLLLFKNSRRFGVEIKRTDAPTLTPSMRIALDDLQLEHLIVLYPGERRYALSSRVTVVPLAEFVASPWDARLPARSRHSPLPPIRRLMARN